MIPGLRNTRYETRLKMLGLHSLKTRRLRGQLIEVFKIINKFDNLDFDKLFSFAGGITRNNGYKLKGKRFETEVARHFFTYSIVDKWNALPANVVESTSVNMFKNKLDKYFEINNII